MTLYFLKHNAVSFPIGEARKSLLAFVDVVEGKKPGLVEKWEPDLIT
jgi:hypothetical protein